MDSEETLNEKNLRFTTDINAYREGALDGIKAFYLLKQQNIWTDEEIFHMLLRDWISVLYEKNAYIHPLSALKVPKNVLCSP